MTKPREPIIRDSRGFYVVKMSVFHRHFVLKEESSDKESRKYVVFEGLETFRENNANCSIWSEEMI